MISLPLEGFFEAELVLAHGAGDVKTDLLKASEAILNLVAESDSWVEGVRQ